jgi:hypothetical protein
MVKSGTVVGMPRLMLVPLMVLPVLAACVVVYDAPAPRRRAPAAVKRAPGFTASERRIVQAYYAGLHRRGGCPPGLAKKHNGCQPPGQAKKRYVRGRPLPGNVVVLSLPRELEIRIGRPPRGYRYGVVDGDVVKLVVGSLLVIDAVTGLGI